MAYHHQQQQELKPCVDASWFVESVPERFMCPICHDVMVQPTQGPCQHEFGHQCIRAWIKDHPCCPVCRDPLTTSMLTPARLMRELVEELPLRCKFHNHGCQARITLASADAHLRDQCTVIECTMPECPEIVLREHLADHLKVCPHNPGAHAARMKTLEQQQQNMRVVLFENLRSGVVDPLVSVHKRLVQSQVRIRTFEQTLDEISIPRDDDVARSKRKELLRVLGQTEAAIDTLAKSISSFKAHCPSNA
ncbi:hypothetical protein PTSG_02736 [Salpingoeca rosetta]|uniref:RING-type domain-containing protein n=1 Tax=Salpingoeca rosetta (strain ATCC 50818 / BSB-021) TaxID=946362 RepID=F2U360_SALR5|nr:uncharacterized protein PTSG_02736 [Salpingoeca rosetta]EGD82054.1 hypothetical protein PTSG_02736 [Salpingoeca rosetta]|eukprot:XP_004996237.1 hypothetical protein PTSG_02736 [Salpingoeca rosetta]